jgi:hypothetical protein
VRQLEKEVAKYVSRDLNYGKAAKRMYNIFRYTGRYQEAAYLRELFDEPTTVLYQIWSLVRTLEDALKPGSAISLDAVHRQADKLILDVVAVLDGDVELEMVRALLNLRLALAAKADSQEEWQAQVDASRGAAINIVNNFFHERLCAVPTINAYIERFRSEA